MSDHGASGEYLEKGGPPPPTGPAEALVAEMSDRLRFGVPEAPELDEKLRQELAAVRDAEKRAIRMAFPTVLEFGALRDRSLLVNGSG